MSLAQPRDTACTSTSANGRNAPLVIRCGAMGSENSLKANTQGQRQREGKPGLARRPSPTAIALLMLGTLPQGHSSTRAC